MTIRKTNMIRKKRNSEIVDKKYADLSKWYSSIHIYLDTVLNSDDMHGLILEGEGGFGKSTIIEQHLNERKIPYRKIKGHMTALELYHKLVEYKDDIIFFDDCEGLFTNRSAISILKGALETIEGTRTIQYNTTSPRLIGNSEEVFKGKIIFSCNGYPDDVNLRALKSRCFYEYVGLTFKDKIEIMTEIAKLKNKLSFDERMDIVRFISNFASESHIFNLRAQKSIEGLYLTCKNNGSDWTIVAQRQLPIDETLWAYYKAINIKCANVNQQVAHFKMLCGASRRTFYRVKQKVCQISQICMNEGG
jgi:hypothetical protein